MRENSPGKFEGRSDRYVYEKITSYAPQTLDTIYEEQSVENRLIYDAEKDLKRKSEEDTYQSVFSKLKDSVAAGAQGYVDTVAPDKDINLSETANEITSNAINGVTEFATPYLSNAEEIIKTAAAAADRDMAILGPSVDFFKEDHKFTEIDRIHAVARIKSKIATNPELMTEDDWQEFRNLMFDAGLGRNWAMMKELDGTKDKKQGVLDLIDSAMNSYLDGDEANIDLWNRGQESASKHETTFEWVKDKFDPISFRKYYNHKKKIYEAYTEISTARKKFDTLAETEGWDTNSLMSFTAQAIPSVFMSVAAAVVTAPLGPGAAFLPAALLSGPEALQTYMAAREAGVSQSEAGNYAIGHFYINTVLEQTGIESILGKSMGTKLIPKAIVAALTESATEFTQAEIDSLLRVYGYNALDIEKLTAEEKLNLFVYTPLKAGAAGGILGSSASVSVDMAGMSIEALRKKAFGSALTKKQIRKYDRWFKKNEKVAKKIEKDFAKFDPHMKLTEENYVAHMMEAFKMSHKDATKQYEMNMNNPMFKIRQQIDNSTWASRLLFHTKDIRTASGPIQKLGMRIRNIPSLINRGFLDPMDMVNTMSPDLAVRMNKLYRSGQIDTNNALQDMSNVAQSVFGKFSMPLKKKVSYTDSTGKAYSRLLNDVIMAYGQIRQGHGEQLRSYKTLNKISENEEAAIVKYVESNPELHEFATTGIAKIMDAIYNYLNKAYMMSHNGEQLKREENYLTKLYTLSITESNTDFVDALESTQKTNQAARKEPSTIENRKKNVQGELDLLVPLEDFVNSLIQKTSRYYGMSGPSTQVDALLKANELSIRKHYGNGLYSQLIEHNQVLARGKKLLGIYARMGNRAANFLRGNSYSVLSYNQVVWVTQGASLWNGISEIGITAGMKGMKALNTNPKAAIEEYLAKSQEGKYRMSIDYTAEEMAQASKAITSSKLTKAGQELKKIGEAGRLPMKLIDTYTTATIWQGAYLQFKEDNATMPQSDLEESAIEFADNAIAKSQPMTNAMHRSALSNTPLLNLFTMFGAARVKGMAQRANTLVELSRGNISVIEAAQSYVYTTILPALHVSLARAFLGGRWDEEYFPQFMSAFIGSDMVLGQIMNSILWDEGKITVSGMRPVELTYGTISALYNGDFDEAIYNAVEMAFNQYTGASITTPYRKIDRIMGKLGMGGR